MQQSLREYFHDVAGTVVATGAAILAASLMLPEYVGFCATVALTAAATKTMSDTLNAHLKGAFDGVSIAEGRVVLIQNIPYNGPGADLTL